MATNKLQSFEFLIFNKSSEEFFVSGSFKADRYATAINKAIKRFPERLYIIAGENIEFSNWRNLLNAWVSPEGYFIPCGYMGHNEFASDFIKQVGAEPEDFEYPYQVLCKKGWLRLLTWSNDAKDTVLLGDDYDTLPNKQQSQTAKDWAGINNVSFSSLFQKHELKTLNLWLSNQ